MNKAKMILRWVYVACIVFFLIRIFPSFWETLNGYDISKWSIGFNKKFLMFVFFGILSVVNILLCFVHCNNEDWKLVWVRMIMFFLIAIRNNFSFIYASVLAKCMMFPLKPFQWMIGVVISNWGNKVQDIQSFEAGKVIGAIVAFLLFAIGVAFFAVLALILETLIIGLFSVSLTVLYIAIRIISLFFDGVEKYSVTVEHGNNSGTSGNGYGLGDFLYDVQEENRKQKILDTLEDINFKLNK